MDNRQQQDDPNRNNSQLQANLDATQFSAMVQHLMYMQNQQQPHLQSPQTQQQTPFQTPLLQYLPNQFQQQQFYRPQGQIQQTQNFIPNVFPMNGIQDNSQRQRIEQQQPNCQINPNLIQGNFQFPQQDLTIGALKDMIQSTPRQFRVLNQMNQQFPITEASDQDYTQAINEFLLKILNMFVVQNQILLEFKNKNQNLEGTVNQILAEVCKLQNLIQSKLGQEESNPKSSQSQVSNGSTENNYQQLIHNILSDTAPQYSYHLGQDQDTFLTVTKGKKLNLILFLYDNQGKQIDASNQIQLSATLHQTEHPYQKNNNISSLIFDNPLILDGGKITSNLQIVLENPDRKKKQIIYLLITPEQKQLAQQIIQAENKNENERIHVDLTLIKPFLKQITIIQSQGKRTMRRLRRVDQDSRSRSKSKQKKNDDDESFEYNVQSQDQEWSEQKQEQKKQKTRQ